jgi:uncharacterized protein YndB with AHSA1/START domain
MTDAFEISTVLPADPQTVYAAWLDSRGHGEFIGGEATIEPRVGGRHSAWGDYIQGVILELEPNRRIVETWRTTEFPEGAPDSRLEVLFEPAAQGTKLTLIHTEIPAGQGAQYREGWQEHYFVPMAGYFRTR